MITNVNVPESVSVKYPELRDLILSTESMDSGEKQYWFDILPSMTDEQVDRLFDILETERRKLEEFELKYQKEIKNLNEKHLMEYEEFNKATGGSVTIDENSPVLKLLNSL